MTYIVLMATINLLTQSFGRVVLWKTYRWCTRSNLE